MTSDSGVFEETDERAENWVDIRMTDPEKGEWDVDVIVVDGAVEYVDLRIQPALLASFIDCLVEDVPESRARDVLATVARRHGIDTLPTDTGAESDGGSTTDRDTASSAAAAAEEN